MASKKKRKLTPTEIDAEIIGNRSVLEWEKFFKPVQKGFHGDLSLANHRIGVLFVKHNGAVTYVGSGTAKGQGMLARLRQLAFGKSTGGHHHAAQKIRKNLEEAELHLLLFKRDELSVTDIRRLANLIHEKHDPVWAASKSIVKAKIAGSYARR